MNIRRDNCIVCDYNLEHLYTFEKFPIYMGISKNNNDILEDQKWGICPQCGTIQLQNLIDQSILYKTPHNPAIGRTWIKHNEEFSKYISKYGRDSILEIGGGNAKIANQVIENNPQKYVIYDQHNYKSHNENIVFENEFYNPDTFTNQHNCNTIVSSHFFEHVYDPNQYIQSFYDNLEFGDRIIFSVPNITNGIRDKLTNALNFEHTYQLDFSILQYLMCRHGFTTISCKYYNEYNIFATFEKSKTINQIWIPNNYNFNKNLWNQFISHHYDNALRLHKEIIKYKNRFLFGCHIFSQYLLYFGLSEGSFFGIIDNDPMKHGYCLYGTKLTTYPSDIIQNLDDVAVIVQAGIYTQEIIDILLSINKECKIIL